MKVNRRTNLDTVAKSLGDFDDVKTRINQNRSVEVS
jgi:hypothetical protein